MHSKKSERLCKFFFDATEVGRDLPEPKGIINIKIDFNQMVE
jgi:hypothetical protein